MIKKKQIKRKTKRKNKTILNESEKKHFSLLFNKATRLLSYRPRSKSEIDFRLRRYARKQSLSSINRITPFVLEVLKEKGFIDDLKFAKWWIKQRIDFKPRGKKLLRAELRKKGVESKIINKAIAFFWQPEYDVFGKKREAVSDESLARAAAEKKAGALVHLQAPKFKQKLLEFLNRKGFSFPVADKITDELREKKYD